MYELLEEEKDRDKQTDEGGDYLVSIIGAKPPHRDPSFDIKYIDQNPFGFIRHDERFWSWKNEAGAVFTLSPEPPGLQVSFWGTNEELEKQILSYIQNGIKEMTEIVYI